MKWHHFPRQNTYHIILICLVLCCIVYQILAYLVGSDEFIEFLIVQQVYNFIELLFRSQIPPINPVIEITGPEDVVVVRQESQFFVRLRGNKHNKIKQLNRTKAVRLLFAHTHIHNIIDRSSANRQIEHVIIHILGVNCLSLWWDLEMDIYVKL